MKYETWINSKWRPALAWLYVVICTFDMLIAPVIWTIAQMFGGDVTSQWVSMTLANAGMFHIVMGTVLGLSFINKKKETTVETKNEDRQEPE